MLQLTQSDNNTVSSGTGILNRKWKALRFIFAKRAFESQLEGVLTAAAGHESNSLPVDEYLRRNASGASRLQMFVASKLAGICRQAAHTRSFEYLVLHGIRSASKRPSKSRISPWRISL